MQLLEKKRNFSYYYCLYNNTFEMKTINISRKSLKSKENPDS